ncbi:DM13 domain-containing protein [Nibrella viscosa]|uniref:DM13 domain-containing protein n=1 Tax=Nibrella viscosa TaxID=1084524 RepID=A0ABP8KHB1_9BACT
MKAIIPVFLLLMLGWLAGCTTTEETIDPATSGPTPGTSMTMVSTTLPGSLPDSSGQTLLAQGTFMANVHPTTGTIRLYQKGITRTLVFTNFRTDGGPDLRIYVAENTALRNFIEVTLLNNRSGNFAVELPAAVDHSRQRFVLIWCKAFSVLFGNAELK